MFKDQSKDQVRIKYKSVGIESKIQEKNFNYQMK